MSTAPTVEVATRASERTVPAGDVLETPSTVTGFADVDRTPDPSSFVAFLDARPTIVAEVKDLVLRLLDPQPGRWILDVGCGTGDDARELADLVGPMGRIVRLDSSAVMVTESRRRAAAEALVIDFVQGDACALHFPDAPFDSGRIERVLVYLEHPERAVAELARAVTPGCPVVVSDVDLGTWFVDSPHARRPAWCSTRSPIVSGVAGLGGRSRGSCSRQDCATWSALRASFGRA